MHRGRGVADVDAAQWAAPGRKSMTSPAPACTRPHRSRPWGTPVRRDHVKHPGGLENAPAPGGTSPAAFFSSLDSSSDPAPPVLPSGNARTLAQARHVGVAGVVKAVKEGVDAPAQDLAGEHGGPLQQLEAPVGMGGRRRAHLRRAKSVRLSYHTSLKGIRRMVPVRIGSSKYLRV